MVYIFTNFLGIENIQDAEQIQEKNPISACDFMNYTATKKKCRM